MIEEEFVGGMSYCELRPDDVLVLSVKTDINDEQCKYLQKMIEDKFPNRKVLVLGPGLRLDIVSPV